jgi:hypothetical protein
MDIMFQGLESKVHDKLKTVSSVIIAVAYFRPDLETIKVPKKVPRVRIIVSKEFDKSDPYKLEEISLNNLSNEKMCTHL